MKYKLCGMGGCGELVSVGVSYCAAHKDALRLSDVRGTPEENERERAVRGLRSSYAWKLARRRRRALDGGRCTFVDDDGVRCDVGYDLDVHHVDPLRFLFDRSPTWDEFVLAATDLDRLRTVCSKHHPTEEELSRDLARADEGRTYG